ncbi:GNAT family N-acetyltransferase [Flaviflagellibacter deserti]|uniref:GNAT family N-acetyltransferase n=1 Tax=Flaviflagellibacter deserti TaxID=2267266 RepID=A0ABV9Z7P8_9HYPH
MSDLNIRTMTPADLDMAIEWAAREGWNPGLDDAEAFLAADPGGFLVGEVDGRPVTCISAVRYGESFGFVGFYIAAPEARGKGYGWATWQAAMERLAGRTVGLDGVVAQQENYRKSGFELLHRNVRYGGTVGVSVVPDDLLVPVDDALVPAIIAYDRPFFAGPRQSFLRTWLTSGLRTSFAYVENGAVLGYGTVRSCRDGYKIGPLFADNKGIADALFRVLISKAKDGPIYLDLPEPNAAARALAERNGMRPVFETARMYRGPAPDLPLSRTYGITSFELG